MRDLIDTSFEALLTGTLAERAERIPASVTLERVHTRLAERRRRGHRVSARRPLMLLGVAAVLLLPIAAFVVGQAPQQPKPGLVGGYEALVRRTSGAVVDIVAVRGDGRERVITSVPGFQDDRRHPAMAVSDDGWLARPGVVGWVFRDLHGGNPDIGPIAPFLAAESGHGWVGDGRFATWNDAGEVTLLDPHAGSVAFGSVTGPLNNVVAMTANGAALVTHGDWGPLIVGYGQRYEADWHVRTIDGASVGEPLAGLDLGWRTGSWWREDGSRVQVCDMAIRQECPGLPNGAVIVESPDGALTTWYRDELAPDDAIDAAFGGTGMWLLLDRHVGGRQAVLARLDTPAAVRAVSSWGVDASDQSAGSIVGAAPDDSLVVVSSTSLLMVDGATGRTMPLDGGFLGFMASAAADTWTGDAFQSASLQTAMPIASLASQARAYPTLRPIEGLIADQMAPGDRVLWSGERAAMDGPTASPLTIQTGLIQLDEGLGVWLECSGPSDVLVTMEGPEGPGVDPGTLTPLLSRCLNSADVAGGSAPSARVAGPVRFSLTTTPDTAWRLVIVDPAPEAPE